MDNQYFLFIAEPLLLIVSVFLYGFLYLLIGMAALIKLDDRAVDRLGKSIMPNQVIRSLLVWTFWPIHIVRWGYVLLVTDRKAGRVKCR